MLDAFRDELFAFMRPDARATVEKQFGEHLAALENFGWRPALRHGDFGGENLLYDEVAQCLSGVIDFGGVALGDPAVDLAAIEAFHPDLAPAMRPAYPALSAAAALRRAAFYKRTFALQQALWALRAGDDDEFREGIADYDRST